MLIEGVAFSDYRRVNNYFECCNLPVAANLTRTITQIQSKITNFGETVDQKVG